MREIEISVFAGKIEIMTKTEETVHFLRMEGKEAADMVVALEKALAELDEYDARAK